jgi:methyl-accepting chemotaxis protein
MFSNLSLKAKIIMLSLVISSFSVVLGLADFLSMERTVHLFSSVTLESLPTVLKAAEVKAEIDHLQSIILRTSLATSEEGLKKQEEFYGQSLAKIESLQKDFLAQTLNQEQKDLYSDWLSKYKNVIEQANQIEKLFLTGHPADHEAAHQLFKKKLDPQVMMLNGTFAKLQASIIGQANQRAQDAARVASFAFVLGCLLIVVGFILSLVIGIIFSSSLSKSINSLVGALRMEAQDFDRSSQSVSGASAELHNSSTEQAAALQQTVASIDEITAMINKNADHSKNSQEAARHSHEFAKQGEVAVAKMISSMDEINASNASISREIEQNNQEVSQIVNVINEIGEKTKIINEIVFQTKLLSFNASVEAARAGEHGKGFAVVAEEVGNLAQMSGQAAHEISDLLQGSISKVNQIVANSKGKIEILMNESIQKVQFGNQMAKNCQQVLEDIVQTVGEANRMSVEISTASQEQAQGMGEISKAMAQIDQVTSRNASSAEQCAAASEQLKQQASHLREIVKSLSHTVNGANFALSEIPTAGSSKTEQRSVTQPKKVLPFRSHPKSSLTQSHRLKTVGSEALPLESDRRFEDV